VLAAIGASLLAAGPGTTSGSTAGTRPTGPARVHSRAAAPRADTVIAPPRAASAQPTPSQAASSPPVRVRIPFLQVTSPLVRLGLTSSGALMVPTDPDTAGWYTGGPQPGQVGPAVIAGHVDSRTGPAVFFRLHELRRGDRVLVTRADGVVLTFRVTAHERYRKDDFPTEKVYGPDPRRVLRLITCGGTFNHRSGHYVDNVVVYAELAGRAPA
jgi:LPXTG-site transpeptidase (sortase) family protein